MGRLLVVATALAGLAVALINPALANNGRPPPPSTSSTASDRPAPIKIGQPTPTPTQTPIKIGPPANAGGGGGGGGMPSGPLTGVDTNKMLDAALNMPLNPTTYTWAVGLGPVLMEPTATHICLLTEVTGNFAGPGEHILLGIDKKAAGGPRFTLSGTSGQKELKASATCARKDRFTPGMFSNNYVGYVELPLGVDTGCGPVQYAGMGQDFSALFVREMVGKFRGGGERIDQGVHGNGTIGMRVSACSGNAGGAIGGVTFGNPLSKTPASEGFGGTFKFYGPNGRTAQHSIATWTKTQESAYFSAAPQPVTLIPVNKGLCGIVMIGGKFQGFGEGVRISAVNGNWSAIVQTIADPGLVTAAFRCIARDQR